MMRQICYGQTDRPILGVGLYFSSLVSVKVKSNSRDASASKKTLGVASPSVEAEYVFMQSNSFLMCVCDYGKSQPPTCNTIHDSIGHSFDESQHENIESVFGKTFMKRMSWGVGSLQCVKSLACHLLAPTGALYIMELRLAKQLKMNSLTHLFQLQI